MITELFKSKESKLELYRNYIRQCTSSPASAENYSDFARLNMLIKNRYTGFTELIDVDDPDYIQQIYVELSALPSFDEFKGGTNEGKPFKKIGGGQYHNALLTYINFLRAVRLLANQFTSSKEVKKSPVKQEKLPRQVIYFGAPGTGKSHEVKRLTASADVIRTTFHPDSDYSTFVGAYKPTTIDVQMRDIAGHLVFDEETKEPVWETRIVYEFVEQAFLQAYIKAWDAYAKAAEGEKAEEQYLVIEEINRGNCAQIFGDLFQLLDRNGCGFSDYPIQADKDMKKQLSKAFEGKTIADAERINNIYGKDIVSKVLSGDILLLPDNLYIWATMNTSDQSLFPIDSAFKRRWDWKYMPICEGKENGVSLGWRIKVNGKLYDWWQFVEKINAEINEQTKSEDKKLGYFFCKAQDGVVKAETFVSKVIFYLWNDVFKDQAFGSDIFRDGEEELTFNKFYDVNANGKAVVKEDKVELFLQNLGVDAILESNQTMVEEPVLDDNGDDISNPNNRNYDYTKFSINGEGAYPKGRVAHAAIEMYVSMHPEMTAEEVVDVWLGLNIKVPNLIETQQMFETRTASSSDPGLRSRYKTVQMMNGQSLYVSNQYNVERITEFVDKVNKQSWGIHIEKK